MRSDTKADQLGYVRKNRGFTLVEVLLAATILFIVVGLITQTYRAATKSSSSATQSTSIAVVVPLLLDTIQTRIRQSPPQNIQRQQGILLGFRFEWSANVIRRGGAAPRFSPESSVGEVGPERFYLWQIELSVIKDDYRRDFQFTELSWM